MSQRPAFRLGRLSMGDSILMGSALLLFIDSFLNWQPGTNAWGGSGVFAGVLMALFALLVLTGEVLAMLQVAMPAGIPVSTIMGGLTIGAILFGIIKFLFVVANHPRAAAWIGLALIVVMAYGAYLKMQADRVGPRPTGFGP